MCIDSTLFLEYRLLSLAKIIITYIYIKKDLVYILSLLKCSILENIFLKYNLFSKRVYFFII
ncbi:TPA: hypothetical protein JDY68_12720 [Clostridioides difficile]|uniref:Putative secreted protein n=1 Tax=Clostridium phage phiCD38-2 TaxID=1032362 RepID=F6K8N3_9CAUD|nr:putative secreted protein [Clostridium phage phiCD38-2]EGT4211825.1 hypothetical protein [Clostridioides difficile]EQE75485.1 putative membrane protein [Clostridioides difficile CD47]EQG89218.1 putative membrane protein [Clostridioides difficile DA00167]EQH32128.1 putative membrane protein [Clostridioides difficile DA00238]EQJ12962.1 putative membrane protein [Clostridioides difficile P9]EQJ76922.1 putative membrane protein [Clostridioides difficile P48]EQJ86462.1 putative membrane protei